MASRDRKAITPGTLLSCLPLFAGLEADLVGRIGAACRIIELPAHRVLAVPGDPLNDAHFLVTGAIKRSALLYDGAEKILELIRPGQLIAPSEVFSTRTYASQIETIEASALVAITVDALRRFISEEPTLSLRALKMMAERHYAAEFEAISHHSLSVNQRVLDYLLNLASDRRGIAGETTVRLDAKKHLIAARLGIAPETFSRALQQLSKDGLIFVSGSSLHIQNALLVSDDGDRRENQRPPLRFPKPERDNGKVTPSPAALVNLCGRHRLLSQRLATTWGMIARKLSANVERIALRKFLDQFEHNLEQLVALSALPQPLPPQVQKKLVALGAIWQDYRELLTAQVPDRSRAEAVFDLSEEILAAADTLTAAMATAAGTVAARQVNVAGRNRMLSARLTKLFLFNDWNVRSAQAQNFMAASREEFSANMGALATSARDTPEVLAQLAIDAEQWRHFIGRIDSAADKPAAEHGHVRAVLAASEELLRHVDTTVKLYELLAMKMADEATA
jgi:CRP-like cAMP-binding protein